MAFKISSPFPMSTGSGSDKEKEKRTKAETTTVDSKGVADVSVKVEKPKVSSAKPTKKEAPKSKSVKRKTARLAKTREKGKQALEDGNTSKAMRLKRRERRLKKRIAKKSKK
jgi:hypothetical protein